MRTFRNLTLILLTIIMIGGLMSLMSCTDNSTHWQLEPPASGEEYVLLETSMGEIKIRLFPEETPLAYENFITHVRNGFYDGIIFHRIVENFMLQTGDPEGTGIGGESIWGDGFATESDHNLKHFRGALSMANRGAFDLESNTSQFFIVQNRSLSSSDNELLDAARNRGLISRRDANVYREHGGTPMLDPSISTHLGELFPGAQPFPGHPVFGQVFYGMDVVDAIAAVEVEMQPGGTERSRPVEEVYIVRAVVQTMD